MLRLFPRTAGILVMSFAQLHGASALAQGTRSSAAEIARAVDSMAAAGVRAGLAPALGVAITMDGRTIYAKSHGFADVTAGVRAGDRTLWYVASTSKSFTGFGVSLLANEGALRFDAPITTLLPNAKWHDGARAPELTLARFLSHTHHLNDNAVVQSAAFTGEKPEARWPSLVALAEPTGNNDMIYSNFGYNVTAMVIDRMRPEGWRKYLEERCTSRQDSGRHTLACPASTPSDSKQIALSCTPQCRAFRIGKSASSNSEDFGTQDW